MSGAPATASAPLLTAPLQAALLAARAAGAPTLDCSLDLGRSTATVRLDADAWDAHGVRYPYAESCRERTVYRWDGTGFAPLARHGERGYVKLVPTPHGAPTFEIDGVKMLPSEHVSPWDDARAKVELVAPRGRRVLDTCGGLGYFAAWCLALGAAAVRSHEPNAEVRWLRGLNPWSPEGAGEPRIGLTLLPVDAVAALADCAPGSFDCALHDPPRFALAGELYSQDFYEALARVLRRGAPLFHWTGAPNSVARGRDLAAEVATRLRRAGFRARPHGDGVLAEAGRFRSG